MPSTNVHYDSVTGRITCCESQYRVGRGPAALLLLTGFEGFKHSGLGQMSKLMQVSAFIDGLRFSSP